MVYIVLIISFILEGIFTNLVSINSLFIPLFTITSLIMLYPYFNNKKNNYNYNYIITTAITGIFYDIAYTNSLFVNTFAFVICGLLVILINNYVTPNILSRNCTNLVIIISYRIITYFILCIFGYMHFNESILLKGIYSSLILNIIFGIILYFLCDKLNKKLNIRKY